MLTRLEVRGFKNLVDVDVRFGPFTCVFGPNGVGKSNLFDAIQFLRLLADGQSFPQAATGLRPVAGTLRAPHASSLFTSYGSTVADRMELAAEMWISRQVVDDFRNPARAASAAVRYHIKLRRDGSNVVLEEESLTPLLPRDVRPVLEALHAHPSFADAILDGKRRGPYLSTSAGTASLHQEGHQGRKRSIPVSQAARTVLGDANTNEFPTALAARREMQSWRQLLLEPSAMRAPSPYDASPFLGPRGENLPAALHRLVITGGDDVQAEVANRLAELVPDVREIRIDDDPVSQSRTLSVRDTDGVWHPARALSDGTLRFLVLAVLERDPKATGLVCFEEPENGIHPARVRAMVRLLRALAPDLRHPFGEDNPLRQVIVNTHSPMVFRAVDDDELLSLEVGIVKHGGDRTHAAIASAPRPSWRIRFGATPLPPGDLESWRQLEFSFGGGLAAEE